jgi:hypothetical protein
VKIYVAGVEELLEKAKTGWDSDYDKN